MTRYTFLRFCVVAAALSACLGLGSLAAAQEASPVQSLRSLMLTETSPAPDIYKQLVPSGGFARAYRQQPPLIPHKVDGYQITATNNACMECHDWPNNTKVGAPKISETHYVDRQGVRLDKVAGTRYFCQQCHVPQLDAQPLVENTFQNATQAQ